MKKVYKFVRYCILHFKQFVIISSYIGKYIKEYMINGYFRKLLSTKKYCLTSGLINWNNVLKF